MIHRSASCTTRGVSISSIRKTRWPFRDRTPSQAASAAYALPICMRPVGDGARRPITAECSTLAVYPAQRATAPHGTSVPFNPSREIRYKNVTSGIIVPVSRTSQQGRRSRTFRQMQLVDSKNNIDTHHKNTGNLPLFIP